MAEVSPERPVTECTAAASPDEARASIAVRLQVSEEHERPVRLRLAASEAEAEAAALPPGQVGSQSAAEPLRRAEAFGALTRPAAPAGAAAQAVDAGALAKQSASRQHDDWLSDFPAAPSSPVMLMPAAAALAAGRELSYAELTAQLAGGSSSSPAPHSAARGALLLAGCRSKAS